MRSFALILLLLALILSMREYEANQRVLERLGPAHTISFDVMPEQEGKRQPDLRVSITIPKNDPEIKIKSETLTTVAKSSKDARIKLSRKSDLRLVTGQLRNILFNMDMAKRLGLWENIDTFVRDPSISKRTKITIVKGSAAQLLDKNFPEHPRTGRYIERMITKENKSQAIPEVTVYHFFRDLKDDGIDPIAPIIKDNGEDVVVTGIGLFDEDRLVGEVDADKSMYFDVLYGDIKQGEISMETGNEIFMYSSLVSSRKIKVVKMDNERFKVQIHLDIKGAVLEYIGDKVLGEEKDRRKLEVEMAELIKKETEAMVRTMQKLGADSIGLGKFVRNSMPYKEWAALDWRSVYPRLEVEVSADAKITNFGKIK